MPSTGFHHLLPITFLIIDLIYIDRVDSGNARANFVPFGDPRLLGHHDADHADKVLRPLHMLTAVGARPTGAPLAIIHDEFAADAG